MLHCQMAQHVQLLLTCFLAAAKMGGQQEAVGATGICIHSLLVCLTGAWAPDETWLFL